MTPMNKFLSIGILGAAVLVAPALVSSPATIDFGLAHAGNYDGNYGGKKDNAGKKPHDINKGMREINEQHQNDMHALNAKHQKAMQDATTPQARQEAVKDHQESLNKLQDAYQNKLKKLMSR